MSECTEHPVGVPCWVDALQPEPERATAFYTELFGWAAEDRARPDDASQPYNVCTLRGRDVAAIGSRPDPSVGPGWTTYVRVERVEPAVRTAVDAGGRVVVEPYEAPIGGRRAILADPAGARLGVWELGAHPGASLVNEAGAWAMSMLNTPDVDGARRFYDTVFGWITSAFDADGSEFTMWRLPGYLGGEPSQPVPRDVVAVMAAQADATAVARWDVNFWVRDADEVVAKAPELGGSVVAPPEDRPPFREAVIADPAGAAVAVSQMLAGS